MRLERVKQGEDVSIYENEEGDIYLLRPVDREYQGRPKKPKYYLSVRSVGSGKAKYLSGLFSTRKPDIFSLDMRDEIGVKRMYTLTFSEGGKMAELEQRKAEKGLKQERQKISIPV